MLHFVVNSGEKYVTSRNIHLYIVEPDIQQRQLSQRITPDKNLDLFALVLEIAELVRLDCPNTDQLLNWISTSVMFSGTRLTEQDVWSRSKDVRRSLHG